MCSGKRKTGRPAGGNGGAGDGWTRTRGAIVVVVAVILPGRRRVSSPASPTSPSPPPPPLEPPSDELRALDYAGWWRLKWRYLMAQSGTYREARQ